MGSTGSAGTPAWCHGGLTPPRRIGAVPRRRCGPPAVGVPDRDTPRPRRTDDREVPVAVGAVHPHPRLRQPGQQPLGGMAVGVVRPDRDERHPGAAGREEGRIGVPAPMVRNLQHVRAEVDPGREDSRLGLGAQVAGEQDPHAALGDPDDHRQVVGLRCRAGPLGVWGEHLDRRRPDRPAVSGHQHRAFSAAAPDQAVERPLPLVGGGQRAGGDDPDLATGQRPREPSRVIGVQVGHQDEREDVDPQPVEAAVDRTHVRPRIDQHAGARAGRYNERISLPDVTSDDEGVGRRPAPDHLPQRPADRDQPHQRGQRERTHPGKPPERPRQAQEQRGQQGGSGRAGGPSGRRVRCRRGALCDHDKPPRGPAGTPDEEVPEDRGGRTDDRRRQPEHGGRGHGGCGEEVGGKGDEAERAGEPGDEWRRGQARGSADGQGVGEERPASPGSQVP